MQNKVVKYGEPLINQNGLKVTHHVTNISIDNHSKMATFVIEGGNNTIDVTKISMEFAQSIGFINIDKLLPYCK
jgi:hypothetical protein